MGDYTVTGSRLLPLNMSGIDTTTKTPHSMIQSITMGLRFGTQQFAIGMIHKFSFTQTRDAKQYYQIEPYADVLGDSPQVNPGKGLKSSFTPVEFDEALKYFPGEAVEVIPGKQGAIELTIDRYSLYTANLLAAVTRASGSGVYDSDAIAPNLDTTASPVIKYINILQQVRPFDIYQIYVSPITGKVIWGRKFGGCWFKEIGEEVPESDKNEPIIEKATMLCTNIRPLTIAPGSLPS